MGYQPKGPAPAPPQETCHGLTKSQALDAIHQRLEGTCGSIEQAQESLSFEDFLTLDEIHEGLEERNLVSCPGCGWWMEAGEIVDDGGEEVGCGDCREKQDD